MRATLGSTINFLARFTYEGACATDPRVIDRINEARERLMKMPENWKGKIQRFLFCSSNACVTLPREIETVEAATVCNSHMKMRGPWYDVLEGGPTTRQICGGDSVIDRGDGYVSFVDLDEPRNIKVYADVDESDGARLLLQGFDENGNRVRTYDETTSTWIDGEYVGINNDTPQVSTTVFSSLDGIQKPETNGFVRIYAFTAGTAGSPATDITTAENWDGDSPAQGALVFGGEAVSATWDDPEDDQDLVIQLGFDGTDVFGNTYTPLGFPLLISVSDWEFNPTEFEFQALGAIINGGAGTLGGTLWEYTPATNAPTLNVGDTVRKAGTLDEFTVGFVQVVGSQYYFEIAGNTTAFTVGSSSAEVLAGTIGDLTIETNSSEPTIGDLTIVLSDVLPPTQWGGEFYAIRIQRTITAAVPGSAEYSALMAILHPDDTLPSYRRYEIPALRGTCGNGTDDTESNRQVIVMAKLRYLPVSKNSDFLVIENLGALKNMLIALDREDKGDFQSAAMYEAKAREILAGELRNHIGDAATSNQPMQVQQDAWSASTIENIL